MTYHSFWGMSFCSFVALPEAKSPTPFRVSITTVILCTFVFAFYVYIRLYLMNILSLQTFCIKTRLKEEIELFFSRIPINIWANTN